MQVFPAVAKWESEKVGKWESGKVSYGQEAFRGFSKRGALNSFNTNKAPAFGEGFLFSLGNEKKNKLFFCISELILHFDFIIFEF